MKWVMGSLLTVAVVGVLTLGVTAAAPATPRACTLLTKSLVEDYFNTDMVRTSNASTACNWQSRIEKTHKAANLQLVTWRLLSNARSYINLACKQKKGVHQLTLPGADKACGVQGLTGLCVTPPKGEDPKDWCVWDVKISFLRGRTTGSIELTSLKVYSLNDLKRAVPFARKLLKRWA